MQLKDGTFRNQNGQVITLRGVSLGANARLPSRPFIPSDARSTFFTVHNLSFLDRPLPLKYADEHFTRLKSWGFNLIRLLVTWEALEHHAAGDIDQAYLHYLHQLIDKAAEYGFWVIIDAHQNVWSRYSGGAGAPRWTFEQLGLAPRQFGDAEAAVLHHVEGDLLLKGAWVTNYEKFAAATMFTLFFGGKDFAAQSKVSNLNPQDWLQNHYVEAFGQLADHLSDCPNVIGFEAMSEPSRGWIGKKDLSKTDGHYHKGKTPTPFEAMVLASGYPLKVDYWQEGRFAPKCKQKVEANPRGVKVWQNGVQCIWKTQGVWDIDERNQPKLCQKDYFYKGGKVDFLQHYYFPFLRKFAQRIRQSNPEQILFFDLPQEDRNRQFKAEDLPQNTVFAPQWLDYQTLYQKQMPGWMWWDFEEQKIKFGEKSRLNKFNQQLQQLKKQSTALGIPSIISQVAVPYDLNKGKEDARDNFTSHEKLWHFYLSLLEQNQLDFMIWNYNPDNMRHEGDYWNREDHSIYRRSSNPYQKTSEKLDLGGRAIAAIVRPYAVFTSGKVLHQQFDYQSKVFEYEFEHEEQLEAPSRFFIPKLHYPEGCKVEVSDGDYELNPKSQSLLYHHSVDRYRHKLRISAR